ncbi:uncharacterized protein LOC115679312 [Syzygium oleosum]|uniref:uncharacterized protein LOC115679312 n=1 Tax=Syzygium oleosum TaxID=219896 RepID=UPI0011D23782|nr:uncharacterized protein LOC115679312 [Syzygium oleosum]
MGGEPFVLPDRPEDSEDDDDALSLSDFPLATAAHPRNDSSRPRRSSSEPPDLFEFLIGLGSHMRSADDLIVSGKLVPLHDQCRRCESLSELERSSVSRSSSTRAAAKAQLARSSRSLDYRRLRRPPSSLAREAVERRTSSSSAGGSGVARSDSFAKRPPPRPLWRVLPFVAVKLPAEMELRDMRSRQLRRTPSALFVPPTPADRGGWKGSWRLIKALSCKDPASVAVATPLACLPHV